MVVVACVVEVVCRVEVSAPGSVISVVIVGVKAAVVLPSVTPSVCDVLSDVLVAIGVDVSSATIVVGRLVVVVRLRFVVRGRRVLVVEPRVVGTELLDSVVSISVAFAGKLGVPEGRLVALSVVVIGDVPSVATV